MRRRLALEHLLEDVAQRHGFSRVQTPVFESLELFTAKSGPGVINQLYAFQDKGERDLTLRPELTAPVMRMVAEEMRMDTNPLRLSYYGQCYRYEEFKTGRYREFFQYGVELIGASGPLAEAEVLQREQLAACRRQFHQLLPCPLPAVLLAAAAAAVRKNLQSLMPSQPLSCPPRTTSRS